MICCQFHQMGLIRQSYKQYKYNNRQYQRMSYSSSIHSALEHCEQYSKSSSKRLFESVFKILDHDQLQISSFDQYETNGTKIAKFMQNQYFVQAIQDKLKSQQLDQLYPILKVQCLSQRGTLSPMDIDDLSAVFEKFGNIFSIQESACQSTYYILYKSYRSAYIAMKLLNNFALRHSCATIYVSWCPSSEYNSLNHLLADYHVEIEEDFQQNNLCKKDSSTSNTSNQILKQCKLTCRYDIQIENQKDFQVARRIIGSKGTNMKKIIESALDQLTQKTSINSNQILKLRLRGRGSGYKQGPEQLQSEEQLHLCISAKDQVVYNYACRSVQKLLQNVYLQYFEYTKKQGRGISLIIKKSDISTQCQTTQINNENVMKNMEISKNGRMQPDQIQHFLQLRNKARRQLNFSEADRIRNYLRACGVCLIDEKGRRGKAAEVTTWKYLL